MYKATNMLVAILLNQILVSLSIIHVYIKYTNVCKAEEFMSSTIIRKVTKFGSVVQGHYKKKSKLQSLDEDRASTQFRNKLNSKFGSKCLANYILG